MPKRQRSGSVSLQRDMQQAMRQRGRQRSLRGGGKVWVNAYTESDGTHVAGHWRVLPASGTVLKGDLQPYVEQLLSAHASAIQRADQVKSQLAAYARAVSG